MMGPKGSSTRDRPDDDRADYAFGSRRYAWVVALILSALQIASNMERQILSLVVEPLRRDFAIHDIEVSLLQGLAFALFYAIVAVPVGWLADRWRRDWIVIIGMAIWCLATLGCMIAQSYGALFLARLMVGLADASLLPAAFSLLSDYFPRASLAGPVGVLTGASFLGTGASLTFGGMILSHLPVGRMVELPVVGAIHGWQLTFGIMCVPGLLLMAAMFGVREPPRRHYDDVDEGDGKASLGQVKRYFLAHRAYLGSLLGGIILLAAYQYGVTNWAVTLFIRAYGWQAPQIGLLYGLYFMIIGTAASLIGGKLCDHLRRKGRADANFLISFGATLALVPLALAFPMVHSAIASAVLLAAITFFAAIPFGPATAAISTFVPPTMRAQSIAFTLLLSTLLGAGAGPWLIAFFTEAVFHDPAALPYSMTICGALLVVPAATCFGMGGRIARRLHQ